MDSGTDSALELLDRASGSIGRVELDLPLKAFGGNSQDRLGWNWIKTNQPIFRDKTRGGQGGAGGQGHPRGTGGPGGAGLGPTVHINAQQLIAHNLHATTAQTDRNAAQILKTTARIENSQILILEERYRKWFQYPPRMTEKQHATQKLHHKGTANWFLQGLKFELWKKRAGSLWIRGRLAGTGKSVLSSIVIRHLVDNRQPKTAIGYFYFDFRDEKMQLVENMLRSIILQLSAYSPLPYSALEEQYEACRGQTLPTYDNLLHILQKLLSEFDHTFLVLDALDECSEADDIVQFISTVRAWTKHPLHILVTSQPRSMFMESEAFEGVPAIALDKLDTMRNDIQLFVSSEVQSKFKTLKHWKRWKDRGGEIIDKIVEKSNGMFRLAACFLTELSRSNKINPDLDTILSRLPSDLFGIYARLLEPISTTDFVYVARFLRWLAFSVRPVNLLELEDALAFNYSDPCRFVFEPSQRGAAMEVCALLEGLVTVEEFPAWMQPRTVVSLAHSSVANYIASEGFRETHKYDLSELPSHTFLAQSCVGYLLHFETNPFNKETHRDYPLASYAARYWSHHLLHCHNHERMEADNMLL
ncbi:hypothetical protein B0H14DRAFT_3771615 [Mycena olivaceomarginata]|nr:hypothetical protein B0H14DRAFT_3771615 [Mycena olivaceomarginata]